MKVAANLLMKEYGTFVLHVVQTQQVLLVVLVFKCLRNMRIIKAKNGFIIDIQNGVDLPVICNDKKELHTEIDKLFPDEK